MRIRILTSLLLAIFLWAGPAAETSPRPVRFIRIPPAPSEITDHKRLHDYLNWLDTQFELSYSHCLEQVYEQSMERPSFLLQSPLGWFGNVSRSNRQYAPALSNAMASVSDPLMRRQICDYLEWFRLCSAPPRKVLALQEAERAVQSRLSYVTPVIDAKEVKWPQIERILLNSSESSRRKKAYQSVLSSSEDLDDAVVHLIKAQNGYARSLGYDDYAEMALKRSGLSRDDAVNIMRMLEKVSREPYRRWLRQATQANGGKSLKPWDTEYYLHQPVKWADGVLKASQSKTRLYALAQALGFEPTKLPVEIETADLTYLGLTWPIKIPGDTRVICQPLSGLQYYRTLFHEYGHALHFTHIDGSMPFVLRMGDPMFYCESMAEVFCQLGTDPLWLKRTAKLTDSQIAQLRQMIAAQDVKEIRLSVAHTEYALYAYAHPDADLRKAHHRIHQRLMMIDYNRAESGAELVSLISSPIIGFNHAVSKAIAAQIIEAAKEKAPEGNWLSPSTGRFLTESFYRRGGSRSWKEKLIAGTGHGLDMRALEREWALSDWRGKHARWPSR